VKLIILAAGYATRLYPLTLDRPKHLLDVAGRPVIEHVLDRLAPIDEIDGSYLVTNSRFADRFRRWASGYGGQLRPEIVDDGTTSEDDRLGAIGDFGLVLRQASIDDDVIVAAGDNLFTESLKGFGEAARERDAPLLAVYDVGDLEAIRKYNAIEIDDDASIAYFEEKPQSPRTTLTGIALYFYPRSCLPLVHEYLEGGNNPDQPGRLVEWLYPRRPVYVWNVPGEWVDIGSPETLAEAGRLFSSPAAPQA
jgi:glucose-1-phosphate thymidylyltransferase